MGQNSISCYTITFPKPDSIVDTISLSLPEFYSVWSYQKTTPEILEFETCILRKLSTIGAALEPLLRCVNPSVRILSQIERRGSKFVYSDYYIMRQFGFGMVEF